jgi:hypothetical protein
MSIHLYSSNDKEIIYQDELEIIYDTRVCSKESVPIRLECAKFDKRTPYLIQITRYRKNNMQESILEQYPVYAHGHVIQFFIDSKKEKAFQSGRWHLKFKILVQSGDERFESKIFQRWKAKNPKLEAISKGLTKSQKQTQEIEPPKKPTKKTTRKHTKQIIQPLASSTRLTQNYDDSFIISTIESKDCYESKKLANNKKDSFHLDEFVSNIDDSIAFLTQPQEKTTKRKSIMNLIYPIEGLKGMSRWIGGFFGSYTRSN